MWQWTYVQNCSGFLEAWNAVTLSQFTVRFLCHYFSMCSSGGKNTEKLTMLQDTDWIGRRPVAQYWALVFHSN